MDEEKEIERRVFMSGIEDSDVLLEQYKLFVESADKISDRRMKANEFFLGLNAAFLALLGFVKTETAGQGFSIVFALAPFGAIVICYLWYQTVRSHKNLNGAKFKVIHAIEKRLPLSLFDTEWEIVERGENKKKYWPFSHIELITPWIFIAIYGTILVSRLPLSSLWQLVCPL